MTQTIEHDVICIGAGFAGLTAALTLQNEGIDAVVVEASARLGGRTWTVAGPDGRPLERGGQLVNGDMVKLLKRVRAAGLSLSSIALGGANAAVVDGAMIRSNLEDPFAVLGHFPVGDSSDMSIGNLIDGAEFPDEQARLLRSAVCELFCADPDELSAATLLRDAGFYKSKRGEAEFQIREGMSALSDAMARSLQNPPLLSSEIVSISVANDGVLVESAAHKWTARACILAMAPPVARSIRITPSLGAGIDDALSSFVSGAVIKMTLSYAKPFWREQGLSGMIRFADPAGMSVLDGSRDDGADRLIVFLGGPHARTAAALKQTQRHAWVLDCLKSALGPQAAAVRHVDESIWIDHPWYGGGYGAHVACRRSASAADTLRRHVGPIVFACSEIADHFPGFVEGAIAAGEHAAANAASYLAAISGPNVKPPRSL